MASIDFTDIMKNKTSYFTEQEIDTMLNYCLKNEKIRDYYLLLTLYRTGRRISEIVGTKPYTYNVGLRPIDIDQMGDGNIEFDILKKRKLSKFKGMLIKKPVRRFKPVDQLYLFNIKNYVKSLGIGLYDRVFPITRRRANQILVRIAKECNIHRSSFKPHVHMFRHSLAINLLKKNPNNPAVTRMVQIILDHSDINVTMTYNQFSNLDIKNVLNKTFGDDE